MKKNKKYYAVNNQEDEEGYILNSTKAIRYENVKETPKINSRNNVPDTKQGSTKLQSGNFIISHR